MHGAYRCSRGYAAAKMKRDQASTPEEKMHWQKFMDKWMSRWKSGGYE